MEKRLVASVDHGIIIHTNDSALSYSINDLVSKDSWFRNFICRKKLYGKRDTMWEYVSKSTINVGYFPRNEEYRELCCALIDKEDLEQFLNDNLKL